MRGPIRLLLWLTLAGVVVCVVMGWTMISRGFSARDEPTRMEAFVATRLRKMSIPRGARDAKNPLPASQEVMSEAMAHFADHCASCHANDGSGGTSLGLTLYPPPPDMRLAATQQLSDGELFYIIHNGIRFTGMPGFGGDDASKDEDSWKLVHFIRHLPRITAEELEHMQTMNPKSPMQLELEQQMKDFLEGAAPAPAQPHKHKGG